MCVCVCYPVKVFMARKTRAVAGTLTNYALGPKVGEPIIPFSGIIAHHKLSLDYE